MKCWAQPRGQEKPGLKMPGNKANSGVPQQVHAAKAMPSIHAAATASTRIPHPTASTRASCSRIRWQVAQVMRQPTMSMMTCVRPLMQAAKTALRQLRLMHACVQCI